MLYPNSRICGQLPAPYVNGGGDSFWKRPDFQLWRACDLDLGSGHTAYLNRPLPVCQISLKSKELCRQTYEWTYVHTDKQTFETGFIRSTLSKSQPKMVMASVLHCIDNISKLAEIFKQ